MHTAPAFPTLLSALIAAALGAGRVPAQEVPAPTPAARARDAAARCDAATAKISEIVTSTLQLKAAFAKTAATATPEQRVAMQTRFRDADAAIAAQSAVARQCIEEFAVAFAAADLADFDPVADKATLWRGLPGAAGDVRHPDRALAAARMLLAHFPDHPAAAEVQPLAVPLALIAAGKVGDARQVLTSDDRDTKGPLAGRVSILLGDLEAASGNRAFAEKRYEAVAAMAPEAGAPPARGGRRQPADVAARRLAMLGEPPAEIEFRTGPTGMATKLSSLRDAVVLLVLWEPANARDTALLPSLAALQAAHRAAGLRVVVMAKGAEILDAQAQSGTDLQAAAVTAQDLRALDPMGSPGFVVVDRKGLVALATAETDRLPLVELAVERLCAK